MLVILIVTLCFALLWFLYWQNNTVETTRYEVLGAPAAFDGFVIAQVSDLHNDEFGERNEYLLEKLRALEPDLVAITGDMIDSRSTDIDVSLDFARAALEIAPVYYVPGNHENRLAVYAEFRKSLRDMGVVVLEDEAAAIERGGDAINIIGLNDPNIRARKRQPSYAAEEYKSVMRALSERHKGGFNIMLAHRPEYFEDYAENDFALVLSGHAHGGQFRIPGRGGLYAPSQGVLPRYTEGAHTKNGTTLIISRGLGSSVFPTRLFNRPELIGVTLKRGER